MSETQQFQPKKYQRKPFVVSAEQVTAENMSLIAEWCGGTLMNDDPKAQGNPDAAPQYIKVDVNRAINERQTKAFIGDWVLMLTGSGFKVYTDKAFRKSFDIAKQLTKEQADRAGIRPPIEGDRKPNKKKRPVPTAPRRRPENPVLTEAQARALANPVAEPEAGVVVATVTSTEVEDKVVPTRNESSGTPDVNFRSAVTGEYVSDEEAAANPETTVAEPVVVISD